MRSISACCLFLLVALSALAQHGKVEGRATFTDGSPAEFVFVYLDAEETEEQISETTDEEGRFVFSRVPVGSYRLYAYAEGFDSDRYSGLVVRTGRSSRQDLVLHGAGTQVEDQEVTGRIPMDWKKTSTGTALTGEFIRELASANNSLEDVAVLSSKVTRTNSDSDDVQVAGGDPSQVAWNADGHSITNPVGGGRAVGIPHFAIAEFEALTGGWQAKHGERSTAVFNVTTRRGTNRPQFGYRAQYRNTELGASKVPGIDLLQDFWHRSLTGEGTLLNGEIRAGFELLGQHPISTREDDKDPPPRSRVRQALFASGPIVRDRAFWAVTAEVTGNDRGSAFTDDTDRRDQVLLSSRFDWKAGESALLTLTANVDQQDESGFVDFDQADTTRRAGARGGLQLGARFTRANAETGAAFESSFQYLRRRDKARPADMREGVGTRFQVPLPPGGVATWVFGDAFANSDQTIEILRAESSWARPLGAGDSHEVEIGGTLAHTGFDIFTEQGADVIDLRVTDDRAFFSPPTLAGREISYGAPRRVEDGSLQAALYAQDKWTVTRSLVFEYGLRADWQDFVGELLIQPRVGISLDIVGDQKSRLFGSWGLFHDNVLLTALQHEGNPDRFWSDIVFAPAYDARAFSETAITDIYKEALSTPLNQLGADEAVAAFTPTFHDRFVLDENLRSPKNAAWTIGFERLLPADTRLLLSYTEAKRTNQLRQSSRVVRVAQDGGEATIRELVLGNSGSGNYRDWTIELQRSFGKLWQLNASYVQSRNVGPLVAPANPLDPLDVVSESGLLPGDRTHVAKMQVTGRLPWKVGFAADFTWQSGTPVSALLIQSDGSATRPFGQNTLRLPSTRQLNASFRKTFTPADGRFRLGADFQIFNLLNERNVFAGRGRFEVPEGVSDPLAYQPLRPTVIATGLDVPRSFQVGLSVSF